MSHSDADASNAKPDGPTARRTFEERKLEAMKSLLARLAGPGLTTRDRLSAWHEFRREFHPNWPLPQAIDRFQQDLAQLPDHGEPFRSPAFAWFLQAWALGDAGQVEKCREALKTAQKHLTREHPLFLADGLDGLEDELAEIDRQEEGLRAARAASQLTPGEGPGGTLPIPRKSSLHRRPSLSREDVLTWLGGEESLRVGTAILAAPRADIPGYGLLVAVPDGGGVPRWDLVPSQVYQLLRMFFRVATGSSPVEIREAEIRKALGRKQLGLGDVQISPDAVARLQSRATKLLGALDVGSIRRPTRGLLRLEAHLQLRLHKP